MSGSIKRSLALLCALLTIALQCEVGDHDWTVVTLTRNGMWGVASDSSQSQAMSEAIRLCQATAGPSAGCGAQLRAAQGAWIIANLCGDHQVMATGRSLVDAEQEALNREIGLQLFYVPDLPPCKRIVTVDSTGAIVPSVSSIPPRTAAAR